LLQVASREETSGSFVVAGAEALFSGGLPTIGDRFGGLGLVQDGERKTTRTWLDSFDWRLYRNGLRLCGEQNGNGWLLTLADANGPGLTWESGKLPRFAEDLPDGDICSVARKALSMRALSDIIESSVCIRTYALMDDLEKRVGSLELAAEAVGDVELMAATVRSLRGFQGTVASVRAAIAALPGSHRIDRLQALLAAVGRRPLDYSSKFKLALDPRQDSDAAVCAILLDLLGAIERNESGTIANIDSEFLHDFRVAVRRARAALSRMKGVLDPERVEYFKGELAWLGKVSSPPRDADVYLLKLPKYKSLLPPNHAEDLAPLEPLLRRDRASGYRNLRRALSGERYAAFKADFREFLTTTVTPTPLPPRAAMPVIELARNRIWKTYKSVVAEARAITGESPDEALHDLRKSFKKLRYVTEFFASLFPEEQMKPYLKVLRRVQDNLGDFNDYAVQLEKLRSLADRLRRSPEVPTGTLLAMGALAYRMEADARLVRDEFAERFAKFDEPESRGHIISLFKPNREDKPA
jgi:CHAD domain-containing protein